MKKKANKRMPTPKQKLIHNSIPTSLFLSDMCLLLEEDTAGTIDSMFTQTTNEDVDMGLWMGFCFGVGIPLFPFFFMR